MLTNEETIAAIATPIGVGAISVIRVSGEESIQSVDPIFVGKKNYRSDQLIRLFSQVY